MFSNSIKWFADEICNAKVVFYLDVGEYIFTLFLHFTVLLIRPRLNTLNPTICILYMAYI